MLHLYGIPNCDTVKKARTFLTARGVNPVFHDFKKEGVSSKQLAQWANICGVPALLNKKGTTWRALSAEEQEKAQTDAGALLLMQEKTSVIKRPVAEWPDGSITVGFEEAVYAEKINTLTAG